MLGKAGTLGVAAWALGKWGKSEWARHAATGFLSIAAYELSKEGKSSAMTASMGTSTAWRPASETTVRRWRQTRSR